MFFYFNIGKLYTPLGASAHRGTAMQEIHSIEHAAILCDRNGMILSVGSEDVVRPSLEEDVVLIDCRGLTALPGFVDSHTHAVFMGERSEEFAMRAQGKSYQEIAATGGGIRSSVTKVRGASAETIAAYSERFVHNALMLGTTTMEVKSGYGLSADAEIELLRAAKLVGERTGMEIVCTWLGAHAVPEGKKHEEYVHELITSQLPRIVNEGLAEFADVFCDEGYFTNDETTEIAKASTEAGLKLRLHVDELADTGGAELAARLRAYSADHLLKASNKGIDALSRSERTVATLLPITALCLRVPYARGREMIDRGCAVAVATDCNPGSSMSENMQLVISLSVIGMQFSPEEALTAATLNGAAALDRATSHGSIERGKVCDFTLFDIPSLAYLSYHIGVSDVVAVIKRGEIIHGVL
jgi:imidazolonepropionase